MTEPELPKASLSSQVENLETKVSKLKQLNEEIIATVLVNLDRGLIYTSDQEGEKNLRLFLDQWNQDLKRWATS